LFFILFLGIFYWCSWHFWFRRLWEEQFWAVLYQFSEWKSTILFKSTHLQNSSGEWG